MSNPVFETSRLIGVEPDQSYLSFLMKVFNDAANNSQVGFLDYDAIRMGESIDHFMNDKTATPRTGFRLVVLEKDSATPIGFGSIKFEEGVEEYPELGVLLDAEQRGKGYGTETIGGLTALAFQYFNQPAVMATCTPENKKSIRMLKDNGFKDVAHHKKDYFNGREMEDSLIHHLSRDDWSLKAGIA